MSASNSDNIFRYYYSSRLSKPSSAEFRQNRVASRSLGVKHRSMMKNVDEEYEVISMDLDHADNTPPLERSVPARISRKESNGYAMQHELKARTRLLGDGKAGGHALSVSSRNGDSASARPKSNAEEGSNAPQLVAPAAVTAEKTALSALLAATLAFAAAARGGTSLDALSTLPVAAVSNPPPQSLSSLPAQRRPAPPSTSSSVAGCSSVAGSDCLALSARDVDLLRAAGFSRVADKVEDAVRSGSKADTALLAAVAAHLSSIREAMEPPAPPTPSPPLPMLACHSPPVQDATVQFPSGSSGSSTLSCTSATSPSVTSRVASTAVGSDSRASVAVGRSTAVGSDSRASVAVGRRRHVPRDSMKSLLSQSEPDAAPRRTPAASVTADPPIDESGRHPSPRTVNRMRLHRANCKYAPQNMSPPRASPRHSRYARGRMDPNSMRHHSSPRQSMSPPGHHGSPRERLRVHDVAAPFATIGESIRRATASIALADMLPAGHPQHRDYDLSPHVPPPPPPMRSSSLERSARGFRHAPDDVSSLTTAAVVPRRVESPAFAVRGDNSISMYTADRRTDMVARRALVQSMMQHSSAVESVELMLGRSPSPVRPVNPPPDRGGTPHSMQQYLSKSIGSIAAPASDTVAAAKYAALSGKWDELRKHL